MGDRILVEFFSTCPGCKANEQLVTAVCSAPRWKERVELIVYRVDDDPDCAERLPGAIRGAALCVDGSPVAPIGVFSLEHALEDALAR